MVEQNAVGHHGWLYFVSFDGVVCVHDIVIQITLTCLAIRLSKNNDNY